MNRRLVLTLAAIALSSCATAAPERTVVAPSSKPLEELEPIYAVSSAYEAVSIRVSSNGCTTKADFVFYVEKRAGSASVAFARKRLDSCRSFAAGHTDLIFTFAELGAPAREPLYLLNPLTPWLGP